MRTINISVATFAAIWGDRQPGESSEDEIIARKFGIKSRTAARADANTDKERLGWNDMQYDVQLPYGFRIFRYYGKRGQKKKYFEAIAEAGRLRRVDTAELFSTLNSLTGSITKLPVNAWENFWKYEDKNGKARPLGELRNPSKVERRSRCQESITLADLGLA